MMATRRHYVTREEGRLLRKWKVVRSEVEPLPGTCGRRYRTVYTTMSRHIFWSKAQRCCNHYNAQEGNAH